MEISDFIRIRIGIEDCIERIGFIQHGVGRPSSYQLYCRVHRNLSVAPALKEFRSSLERLGYKGQTWNNIRFGVRWLFKGNGVNISIGTIMVGHPSNFKVYIDEDMSP